MDKKMLDTECSITICRQSGDKWQSKTLFLTILDLRSSTVLKFSMAPYLLWFHVFASYWAKTDSYIRVRSIFFMTRGWTRLLTFRSQILSVWFFLYSLCTFPAMWLLPSSVIIKPNRQKGPIIKTYKLCLLCCAAWSRSSLLAISQSTKALGLSDTAHTEQAAQISQLQRFTYFNNQGVLPFSESCIMY